MISDMAGGLLVSASPCKDEVVQAGDAEHGVVNAVALQPAVAEDLPAFHPGEGVLHAGADFAVGGVVLLLPVRELALAYLAAVRDDQAGTPVAAVCDDRGLADGVFRAGQLPRLAVVAVAGQRSADGDDEPGVGVDDDLVVGGVPVVLGLLGDGVVAGGNESVPSTMSTVSLRNRLRCWSASAGPRWSMMRSAADLDTPNSGASWRRVRFVRQ